MENLARYVVRASFSQERMTYIPEEAKVVYRPKDGKNEKTFDALEWLAAMCSHVPNKGEQVVRYYGYYSNVCQGQRKKANEEDGLFICILQPDESSKGYLRNWARLIPHICASAIDFDNKSRVRRTSRHITIVGLLVQTEVKMTTLGNRLF